jgi:Flp pilus assembly protein TadD
MTPLRYFALLLCLLSVACKGAAPLLTNLGLVELQRGNFQRARRLLGRARRVNPDVAQPHHGLGVLAERLGRPDKASKHYQEALAIDPGFAAARANLARLFFDDGMYEHAREEFKRLAEVAPEDPQGVIGLAESLMKLKRYGEADSIVAEARTRFPDRAELVILEARGDIRHGRYDIAVQALESVTTERDDLTVAALGWLGTAELARGRPLHAGRAARRALRLAPSDPLSQYVLSKAEGSALASQH